MKAGDIYPGKYYSSKTGDVNVDVAVTIADIEMEEVGAQKEIKPVLYFSDSPKALILNKTNVNSLTEWFGDETKDWQDKQIILYKDKTMFQGKNSDCIRLRKGD